MIQMILLAAGLSRRFGSNKLLSEWAGLPLYRYSLDALVGLSQRRRDCPLLVVTRYEEIRRRCAQVSVPVCWNEHSERGITSSLHLGLKAAPEADFYLCSVADQPELTTRLLEDFLDGFLSSGKGIGCLSHQGRSGNPVIFSRRYREELLALTGDQGGKLVLRRHPEDCFFWEGPALHDIDRPEDQARLQNIF